jgi:hypothetical protein
MRWAATPSAKTGTLRMNVLRGDIPPEIHGGRVGRDRLPRTMRLPIGHRQQSSPHFCIRPTNVGAINGPISDSMNHKDFWPCTGSVMDPLCGAAQKIAESQRERRAVCEIDSSLVGGGAPSATGVTTCQRAKVPRPILQPRENT